MFDRLKRLVGLGSAPTPPVDARQGQQIEARYENAYTTDENKRQWELVDYLSAKSANSLAVRRPLRNRSRHELGNNPHLHGILTGNAGDIVGSTGPTLKCLMNEVRAKIFEVAWRDWCQEIGFVEKVRTCVLARSADGEGILLLKTVAEMEHPVKIYPLDIETDQVTTVMPQDPMQYWVDGLILHPVTGRPTAFTIMKRHPGDYFFAPGANPTETVKAKYVAFFFHKWRPGQVRGVPLFTPSLDLFVELRSYRKAILQKAQIAANLTAVLETEAPADADGSDTPEPWENLPIDRGTLTTVPAGSKLHQYDTGDPSATYVDFKEQGLGEAIRPMSYPLNLALGTSQKFNFSSARLDHVNYRNTLDIERENCNRDVLDVLLAAFVEEAALIPGLLPPGVRSIRDVPHEWHWPGYQPLDPVTDAAADHARLSNGTMTWREYWAKQGRDWREMMTQQAEEMAEMERHGLVFGDPIKKTDKLDKPNEQAKPQEAGAAA